MGWNNGGHGYWASGWTSGSWMGVGMVLFWGAVIVGLVLAIRWAAQSRAQVATGATPAAAPVTWPASSDPSAGNARALARLGERFADGELTEEEYCHRREVLLGH